MITSLPTIIANNESEENIISYAFSYPQFFFPNEEVEINWWSDDYMYWKANKKILSVMRSLRQKNKLTYASLEGALIDASSIPELAHFTSEQFWGIIWHLCINPRPHIDEVREKYFLRQIKEQSDRMSWMIDNKTSIDILIEEMNKMYKIMKSTKVKYAKKVLQSKTFESEEALNTFLWTISLDQKPEVKVIYSNWKSIYYLTYVNESFINL